MKKHLFAISLFVISLSANAQTPMKWLNQPKAWNGTAGKLTMTVDPGTDYWRITHYGFIRDSGPFYFKEQAGNFEATVKVSGKYNELFHQAGLMVY